MVLTVLVQYHHTRGLQTKTSLQRTDFTPPRFSQVHRKVRAQSRNLPLAAYELVQRVRTSRAKIRWQVYAVRHQKARHPKARLQEAYLHKARLRKARLQIARLQKACLQEARPQKARVQKAWLQRRAQGSEGWSGSEVIHDKYVKDKSSHW